MTPEPHGEEPAVVAAEAWFVAHGLPYFVDAHRASAAAGLRRGRVAAVAVLAALVGVLAAILVGTLAGGGVAAGHGAGRTSARLAVGA